MGSHVGEEGRDMRHHLSENLGCGLGYWEKSSFSKKRDRADQPLSYSVLISRRRGWSCWGS